MRSAIAAATRVLAMTRKETLHIFRDIRVVYMAFGMPLVLLLLFGYAVSFDLDRLPIAVVDRDRTTESRAYVSSLVANDAFAVVVEHTDSKAVESAFRRGEVKASVEIPAGFAKSLARNEVAQVQLLFDGSDGTTANIAVGYMAGITKERNIALASRVFDGFALPLELRTVMLFNPAMKSALFVVPGLIALVLAIMAVLLTALTVAREWERGSMEQLFSTPVRPVEIVVGKLVPYLAIGLIQTLLVVSLGAILFDVPVRGSLIVLFACASLFLAAMLGQGLLISVITKNQQVATQVGIISSMLPTMLLSGFLFPVANMPVLLRYFAQILPSTHFIAILRGILLKGNELTDLWHHIAALAAFATVMVVLSTATFRRRIA